MTFIDQTVGSIAIAQVRRELDLTSTTMQRAVNADRITPRRSDVDQLDHTNTVVVRRRGLRWHVPGGVG